MNLPEHIIGLVEQLKEPLALDRWFIKLEHGPLEDAKAACNAEPEYKQATISFDLEKLQTGDELEEIIVHEMMHPHSWILFKEADDLAHLAADMAPASLRDGLRKKLTEGVRQAGEDMNTQVAFIVLKLLRRLWAAEKEVKELKKRLKKVDKGTLPG